MTEAETEEIEGKEITITKKKKNKGIPIESGVSTVAQQLTNLTGIHED